MRKNLFFLQFINLLIGTNLAYAKPSEQHSESTLVEYVKVCSLYGAKWLYIPGTDQCYDVDTGMEKSQTSRGTVTKESTLAARVSQLEAELRDIYLQLGLQPKT